MSVAYSRHNLTTYNLFNVGSISVVSRINDIIKEQSHEIILKNVQSNQVFYSYIFVYRSP